MLDILLFDPKDDKPVKKEQTPRGKLVKRDSINGVESKTSIGYAGAMNYGVGDKL